LRSRAATPGACCTGSNGPLAASYQGEIRFLEVLPF
jgi:hypothetical protein